MRGFHSGLVLQVDDTPDHLTSNHPTRDERLYSLFPSGKSLQSIRLIVMRDALR